MELILPVFIIAAALIFAFGRMSRTRANHPPEVERPRRQTRRERKLEAWRTANPDPDLPTMFDLMIQEADELGVNDIPGGEGLEVPVKLKVWRRDEAVRTGCETGVRFQILAGVDPQTATEDHVQLVCDDGAAATGESTEAPERAGRQADEPKSAQGQESLDSDTAP